MLQPRVVKSFVFENGPTQLRVRGRSMFPFFEEGQHVLVKPVNCSLRVGRIYAYVKNNTMVGHRLVRVKKNHAVFIGDGNDCPESVDIDSIIGECVIRHSWIKQYFIGVVNFIYLCIPIRLVANIRHCFLQYCFQKG